MTSQVPSLQKRLASNQFYDELLPNRVMLRMMLIPEGQFLMCSPKNEPGRQSGEGFQHLVTVTSFFLGKYPITQAQWQAVASLPKVRRPLDPNPLEVRRENYPIEKVSWQDATEFCARLSQYTHRLYQLPTEVEWEYACRAGTTTPFHFGETISTELANYNGTQPYGKGSVGHFRKESTPIDYFEVANAWGLSDMHGNVWEWCGNNWNYDDSNDPKLPFEIHLDRIGEIKALRGGSWSEPARRCRSASRIFTDFDPSLTGVGFRVACAGPLITTPPVDENELVETKVTSPKERANIPRRKTKKR
jgi:formylglycine-generating enzyme required for sulfatase activity